MKQNKSPSDKKVTKAKKRGKLAPRRLLSENDTNHQQSGNSAATGQARTSQVVSSANSSNVGGSPPVLKPNLQEAMDDAASTGEIHHDGVLVGVPESEDDFGVSESEYEDEENEESRSEAGQQHENSYRRSLSPLSDDPEITLSTKKRFLRKELERDPQLREVFDELVEEKADEKLERRSRSGSKKQRNSKTSKVTDAIKNLSKGNQQRLSGHSKPQPLRVIKSPSDSTLYTPALKRITNVSDVKTANNIIDKISNFVESVRLDNDTSWRDESTLRRSNTVTPQPSPQPHISSEFNPRKEKVKESASDKVNRFVIDVEKLKASLVAPQGMLLIKIDENVELLRNLDSDDEFFHVSCHIDQALKNKIEKGEFVDLEKLLLRDRSVAGHTMDHPDGLAAMQLYTKNGQAFFAPPDSDKRITGIKRWDQAFRVYATIFTKDNPERASEIWQYVHVIHTATATYNWNNVAFTISLLDN